MIQERVGQKTKLAIMLEATVEYVPRLTLYSKGNPRQNILLFSNHLAETKVQAQTVYFYVTDTVPVSQTVYGKFTMRNI